MLCKRMNCIGSMGLVVLFLLAQTDSALAVATAPPLGTAQSFGVLAASTVTNTGATHVIGDLGLSPGTSVTGFPPGIVVPPGTIHGADAVALGAQNDATTAYNNLAGQACNFGPYGPTDLAGKSLVPGVYCFSSSVANTGSVTLNGSSTDIWVFKVGSTLTTGPGSSVLGTGSKCNVYWQIGSSATIDTTSKIEGTIIALQNISLNNGATLNGRAFARNGAATLINDTIDAGGCSGVAPLGGVGLFKTFGPSTILTGGVSVSTLTITFTNSNTAAAVLTAAFTDTFPSGLSVASSPNLATTCGVGVPTAGVSSVTLPAGSTIPGGSVAVPGFCTLTVDVTASAAACYLNTIPIGALQTDGGSNASAAAVNFCVSAPAITPTLYLWAIIALTLLLALAGFTAIRKRNA